MKKTFIFGFLGLASSLCADPATYAFHEGSGPGFTIEVPYSLGTHKGRVAKIDGEVVVDAKAKSIRPFKLSAQIDAIDMGKPKMNCHMQEALGLDYARSDFPEKHVCDSKNALPKEGKNAVSYLSITFESSEVSWKHEEGRVDIKGEWTIHGQKKADTLSLRLTPKDGDAWALQGAHTLSLADFGVQVKPFLLIKVKGPVHLNIDATLLKKP